MEYFNLIEQARTSGAASEKRTLAAAEQLSHDLAAVRKHCPRLYRRLMRNQHAAYYGRHYSQAMAVADVSRLVYSQRDEHGEPVGSGEHWTAEQTAEALKGETFHRGVTEWDKYVALNAMYADLCDTGLTEEQIIRAAYAFYFDDADWQPAEDDCTKVWDYMTLAASISGASAE